MAGIIAAQDNGTGVVGVAPGVRIWNVKCTGPAPYNTVVNLIKGMDYVTANATNIAVASISIATSGNQNIGAVRSAVRRMVQGGIVVVAAAGNNARDIAGIDGVYTTGSIGDDVVPAALPEAMAVSAMDPATDTLADFSNYSQIQRTPNYVISPGNTIDVAAPGVNCLTTATSKLLKIG